ncbi:MAG: glutaminyl-peptide cyclotransferase [Candidatus Electronema sp. V4]|uniref:glutaminyl-peptide cyclotransferase n=1 Tax=Candidatus Electronema sp. V4 TaxID=3454756 RepID=UPI0040557DA8
MLQQLLPVLLASILLLPPLSRSESPPEQLTAVAVQEYPHDPNAFTQGLVWEQGKAYEGTGLHGRSSLRQVELATGAVLRQLDYGPQFFAEGLTVFGGSIYQLTWRNGVIFQYDKESFALRKVWPWPCEGWGITHDGSSLIVSDGSATLYFLNPDDLSERRRLTVRDQGREIDRLNELEYIDGLIYANIWQECRIALIRPDSGEVTAWLDAAELCARMQHDDGNAVLNGIMRDPDSGRLFLTGKLWPRLFEVKAEPARRKPL